MRILITGLAGAGKTTLARRLAAATGVPAHSLDDLYYGPGLAMAATFPGDIERITAGPAWIFDSGGAPGLGALRDLMWARADTLVWLDYPRAVVLRRAVLRSLRRIVTRKRLWHGHRDSLRAWLREDHPVRRAWSAHHPRRRLMAARLADPAWAHLHVVRLPTPTTLRSGRRPSSPRIGAAGGSGRGCR